MRFLITQAVAACLLIAAAYMGWPQMMYEGDQTRITAAIALAGLIGVVCEGLGWKAIPNHLIDWATKYGLAGTVIGLGMVARESGGDYDAVLAGVGTAFYTTLAGLAVEHHLSLSRKLR